MPRYTVIVNRTASIDYSVEVEVTAKDAIAAETKVTKQIQTAVKAGTLAKDFDWDTDEENEEFEYTVEEA